MKGVAQDPLDALERGFAKVRETHAALKDQVQNLDQRVSTLEGELTLLREYHTANEAYLEITGAFERNGFGERTQRNSPLVTQAYAQFLNARRALADATKPTPAAPTPPGVP